MTQMPDLHNLPLDGIREVFFESAPIKHDRELDRPHHSLIKYWNGTEVRVPVHSKQQHNDFIERLVNKAESEGTAVYRMDPERDKNNL